MGLPALVTRCDLRSISLKADCRPYCQAVRLAEGSLHVSMKSSYPLSLKLLPALCVVDRVGEDSIIPPELELCERRAASEEVEHAADHGTLLLRELDTRRGLDISALDLELSNVGRRHPVLLLLCSCWRSKAVGNGRCALVRCGLVDGAGELGSKGTHECWKYKGVGCEWLAYLKRRCCAFC